jgi:tyrosine-protein kinase Etk/Wzc
VKQTIQMENKYNLLGVLKTLFKWKRQILTVCVIAGVGSVIISLLLPVYYQAATVFFVASPDQAKPELIFGRGTLAAEYYGNENDIDRILTIAESNELVDFLVDSFNLYSHYKIDSTGVKAPYKVKKAFFKRYKVQKTKRDAIELMYEDHDRLLSARIASAARQRINEISQHLIKESLQKKINTFEDNILNKEELLKILGDSLVHLREKYGIYNSEAQTETLTAQVSEAESKLVRNQARLTVLTQSSRISRDTVAMVQALVKGMEEEVMALRGKMKLFNDGLGKFSTYEKQYVEANQSLSENKEALKQLVATYHSDIPAVYLVEEAQPPVVKSRPKRSLVVLAAVAIAFFFSIIGVLLIDTYKGVNWREIYHGR